MRDKVALVTGAGRGIGRAIVIDFAAAGARVACAARTQSELDEVAQAVRARGGVAIPFVADLSEPAAPASLVHSVTRDVGPIDVLVNNAAVASSSDPRPVVDFRDEFWALSFQVNVTAPYLLSKLVLPGMIARRWGRIINVASVNGKVPNMHSAAYTASKHALIGLTKVIAIEVAEFGVTANAICPATTRSRLNDKRLSYDSERLGVSFEELERRSTPLGRRLEPEEVSALAVFLAGNGALAINGQSINVCGGKVVV